LCKPERFSEVQTDFVWQRYMHLGPARGMCRARPVAYTHRLTKLAEVEPLETGRRVGIGNIPRGDLRGSR
jgi:hypothetical protein